jgi:hypothetical protein
MDSDWNLVDLAIPNEYYSKHTDLSYVFMLWGRKRLICPVKFMRDLSGTQTHVIFQMPKWWVAKNKVNSLVIDKGMKETLFPARHKPEVFMPLLDAGLPVPTITIAEATADKPRTQEPRRLF